MADAGFISTIQLCFLTVRGGAWVRDFHTTREYLLQSITLGLALGIEIRKYTIDWFSAIAMCLMLVDPWLVDVGKI